jgi:hypothetical protein
VIGFSFTPIPSVQGGFFNPLFWTVVDFSSFHNRALEQGLINRRNHFERLAVGGPLLHQVAFILLATIFAGRQPADDFEKCHP